MNDTASSCGTATLISRAHVIQGVFTVYLRKQGLVRVLEHGRHKANLFLQTRNAVPGADIVVIHQLMIGAYEETYLQTANTFTLMNSGTRDTRLNWGMWSY